VPGDPGGSFHEGGAGGVHHGGPTLFVGRSPQRIQADNGSEFISKALDKWAYENKVALDFSRPGKPSDNALIESFNGSFRDECLNIHWLLSLDDARQKIEQWRRDYNRFRPHSSLGKWPRMSSPKRIKSRKSLLLLSAAKG